jgi:hypothetical protein
MIFMMLAALVAVLLPAAASAAADPAPAAPPQVRLQEGEPAEDGDSGFDVVPGLVWTTAGVAIAAVVMGVLYLFKRRIGGFPANPSWVAPITIMESKDFPAEGDYGDTTPDSHH